MGDTNSSIRVVLAPSDCQVGMRNFHLIKHGKAVPGFVSHRSRAGLEVLQVIPTINVERLWSLVSEQTRLFYKVPSRMLGFSVLFLGV